MVKRITLFLLAIMLPFFLFSQTTGKVAGTVTSAETGEPIAGANVVITDAAYPIGAATGSDGYFVILNVPPGDYTIEVTYMGKKDMIMKDVAISSGRTTELNIEMENRTLEGQSVVVQAQRELVRTDATSSESVSNAEDIEELPIRGVGNIAANAAGVISQDGNLYFRGGREDEVGYYVDGVSTRNPVNNENAVHVIHEAIQEVNVMTGGYTAGQGGANSGIVSTKMKTGSPDFHGSLEYRTDGFRDPAEGEKVLDTYNYGHQDIIGTISGPLFTDKATFFLAGEYQNRDDNEVRFSKGYDFSEYDLVDESGSNAIHDTVDLTYPDGYTPYQNYNRYSLNGTVTLDLPVRLTFSGIYSHSESEVGNDPMVSVNDRRPYNVYDYGVFTAKATKQFTSRSYFEARVSRLIDNHEQRDGWFDGDWEKWYDSTAVSNYLHNNYDSSSKVFDHAEYEHAWDPREDYQIMGFPIERNGTPRSWYGKSELNGWEYAVDFKTQLGKHHEITTGADLKTYTYRNFDIAAQVMMLTADPEAEYLAGVYPDRYGSIDNIPVDDWFTYGSVYATGYDRFGDASDEKNIYYKDANQDTIAGITEAPKQPMEFSAYVQDKIEYNDLVINAGLRLDYFDPDDRRLKNPGNPEFYPASSFIKDEAWEEIDPYLEITPRLGFSFPTGPASHFYLYYGKFVQMPQYSNIYNSAQDYKDQIVDHRYFYDDPIGFGLEPTYTTQYEIGYNKAFQNAISLGVNAFYKNQKGLVQSELQELPANSLLNSSYIRLSNGDFTTTKGIELRVKLRRVNRLAGSINYTFTDAEGTASNSTSYHTAVYNGTPISKVVNPLNYSVTHSGTVNLDYRFGDNDGPILENSGANLLLSFSSGHPYTRVEIESWGQAGAYEKGTDYLSDSRNRIAIEPFGASKTPWTFTLDLRLYKSFKIGPFTTTAYANVTNLLNTKNVRNVYPLTGQSKDDGLISNPDDVENMESSYGYLWEEMYRAINIENGQAYWDNIGRELWGNPRQIDIGIRIEFQILIKGSHIKDNRS